MVVLKQRGIAMDEITSEDTNTEHGHRHFGARLVIVIVVICFGTSSYGFSNAAIGSTLGQPSFIKAMGLTGNNATALEAAVLALYFIGGLFGSACHGLVADRYGRKASASVASAVLILGAAVCTGAPNMGVYIAFRFFCGWA